MMTLINTVFITLLFSFWVWTLKQDIQTIRKRGRKRKAAGVAADEDEADTRDLTTTNLHPAYQNARTRDRAGVPTYTIG